jgi:hypothetical protein
VPFGNFGRSEVRGPIAGSRLYTGLIFNTGYYGAVSDYQGRSTERKRPVLIKWPLTWQKSFVCIM